MQNNSVFLAALAVGTTILSLSPAGAETAPPPTSAQAASGDVTTTVTLDRAETAINTAFVSAATTPIPAAEASFVAMINELRTSQGLNTLTPNSELTTQARVWTEVMVDADRLHHASDLSVGVTADWQVLGENVGVHSVHDLDALFRAFVNSPSHYANLVDPRFNSIGVGVMQADDGDIWTTHRFMAATTSAPPSPPTKPPPTSAPVTQPPATRPAPTAPPTTASPNTSTTDTEPTPEPQPAPEAVTEDDQADDVEPTAGDEASTNDLGPGDESAGSDTTNQRVQLDIVLIGDIIDEVAKAGL